MFWYEVELCDTVRTETLRHAAARAWKVFATSRSGRLASNVCTLPMKAPGMASRNSCAFCGCWAQPARTEHNTGQANRGCIFFPRCFVFFLSFFGVGREIG